MNVCPRNDAKRFTQTLAGKLGVTDAFMQSAYEDMWYYQWRERRLPVNVDPANSKLDDEMERARLRRVFTQKLDSVVGYVLPIKVIEAPGESRPVWTTGSWFLRDERMYLMPGDSPMGLRLPLASLPWVSEADYPYLVEQDPSASRPSLPVHGMMAARYQPEATRKFQTASGPAAATLATSAQSPAQAEPAHFGRVPQPQESAPWVTRTALCVEVRDPRRASGPKAEAVGEKSGVIYIFMPPLEKLDDYLDLLAAIEATAEELDVKIVLEGYPPPRDPRLKLLQVTPDPGVIEVNIHPVTNWKDLVKNTEFLYNVAFESRLSAEKFMKDGRHTDTGGGNHFVMGGRHALGQSFPAPS